MNNESKEVDITYRKMLGKKTGEQRILMGFSMFHFSTKILLSSMKEKISSKNLKKHIFLKIYGSDFDSIETKKILNAISS